MFFLFKNMKNGIFHIFFVFSICYVRVRVKVRVRVSVRVGVGVTDDIFMTITKTRLN